MWEVIQFKSVTNSCTKMYYFIIQISSNVFWVSISDMPTIKDWQKLESIIDKVKKIITK